MTVVVRELSPAAPDVTEVSANAALAGQTYLHDQLMAELRAWAIHEDRNVARWRGGMRVPRQRWLLRIRDGGRAWAARETEMNQRVLDGTAGELSTFSYDDETVNPSEPLAPDHAAAKPPLLSPGAADPQIPSAQLPVRPEVADRDDSFARINRVAQYLPGFAGRWLRMWVAMRHIRLLGKE